MYEKEKRNEEIYQYWLNAINRGNRLSFDTIGEKFNLNGERVRQIVRREEKKAYE